MKPGAVKVDITYIPNELIARKQWIMWKWEERDGNWAAAAQVYQYVADNHKNQLWMSALAARSFFKAGDHKTSLQLSRQVNGQRPTVETLLLEAKVQREQKDFETAVGLLEHAEQILEGKQLQWT